MSSRDRLFGGGQTILEQLLEGAVNSGVGTDLLQKGTDTEIREMCPTAWY